MNRARLLLAGLALGALAGWLLIAPVVLAQDNGLAITGQVVNATPGGSSVSGVTVVLHQQSVTTHQDLETVTDAEGQFRFSGVIFDPTVAYGVSVRYQEALYGVDLDLGNDAPVPVLLTVYDATSSDDALSAPAASVMFPWADGSQLTVAALEIVTIANSSDRTYVPGPEPMKMLRFGLPPDAQQLRVETRLAGADFIQVDRGFALVASVPPGEHEVMYTYEFPYSGDEASFTKSFIYGAGELRVLAPDEVLRLSSKELGSPEAVTIGERPYQLLLAAGLPKGAQVSLDLKGLPASPVGERLERQFESIRFEYIAPVGLGLLMASLLCFVFWRNVRRRRVATPAQPITSATGERDTILAMIADLEQSLQRGEIVEEEYRRRLHVLRGRLSSPAGS